jgi:DNA-binding FadR family transcriptional regulator
MLLGRTTLAAPGRAESSRAEHQAIVDALSRRDPQAAELAARAHIISAYRIRLDSTFNAPVASAPVQAPPISLSSGPNGT